jgi:O-acetyl-ADP-ribose deacetylase (regulator of RNase III)
VKIQPPPSEPKSQEIKGPPAPTSPKTANPSNAAAAGAALGLHPEQAKEVRTPGTKRASQPAVPGKPSRRGEVDTHHRDPLAAPDKSAAHGIELVQGGLSALALDVLIYPRHGDEALLRTGGLELVEALRRLPPVQAGEVTVTQGFGLPCRHVLHVGAVPWGKADDAEVNRLRRGYQAALRSAHELKARTVGLSPLATSPTPLAAERAARVALSSLLGYEAQFARIVVCLPDPATFALYARLLSELRTAPFSG